MTQPRHYRECLLRFTWDNARHPSIVCPLNSYAPMPFRERAVVELVNEISQQHVQYFYVDYEALEDNPDERVGYFHAEFRRENSFGG
jgi:hypothetical protein